MLRHWASRWRCSLVTIAVNWLSTLSIVPKGFFPQQDTGHARRIIQASQDTRSRRCAQLLGDDVAIVQADPAIDTVVAFTGGGGTGANPARMFISLKPLAERRMSADAVIARLRAEVRARAARQRLLPGRPGHPGRRPRVERAVSVHAAGRRPRRSEPLGAAPDRASADAIRCSPTSTADQQNRGPAGERRHRSRHGRAARHHRRRDRRGALRRVRPAAGLDDVHRAEPVPRRHGSGAASTGSAPRRWRTSTSRATSGALVPLSAPSPVYRPTPRRCRSTTRGSSRRSRFVQPAARRVAWRRRGRRRTRATRDIGMPATIHGSFQGTARVFQESLASEPWLILAALVAVYIVLGMLYESLVHPLTILSTLPSAGVGATLALLLCRHRVHDHRAHRPDPAHRHREEERDHDDRLRARRRADAGSRRRRRDPRGVLLRFRPILMTTMAALLGALPMALGGGDGSELRRPLGIADRRRADRQPGADALHDAGDLRPPRSTAMEPARRRIATVGSLRKDPR